MADFKNILFPTDFSPRCEAVIPHVAAMAHRYGSQVTVLNVLEFPAAQYFGFPPSRIWSQGEIDQMRHEQQQSLQSFIREHLPGANVRAETEEGEAARVITEMVLRDGLDLVMMPTVGMGPFRRYLIGSVTAKVLNDASCPVWTSVHSEERPLPVPPPNSPVLCAVNLEAESIPLLQFAAELAASWSTTLRVLHVVPAVDELSHNRGVAAVREYLFEKARNQWTEICKAANAEADLMLAGGDVSRAVAEAVQSIGAQVVVIARAKMQKALGGLRTRAYSIIRESPCPVIAV
jgi:nucleotide-binding universal stress UspA family protein